MLEICPLFARSDVKAKIRPRVKASSTVAKACFLRHSRQAHLSVNACMYNLVNLTVKKKKAGFKPTFYHM